MLLAVWGGIALALLAGNRRWRLGKGWRNVHAGVALGLVITVAVVLAESFWWQPLFVPRFFTPLVPLYCFVLGAALTLLWPWLRMFLVACVLLASVWEHWKPFTGPLPVSYWWRPMVQHLAADLEPHDVVITYPSFLRMPVDYYLDKLDPAHTLPRPTEYASGYYRQGSGVEPEPDGSACNRFLLAQQGVYG